MNALQKLGVAVAKLAEAIVDEVTPPVHGLFIFLGLKKAPRPFSWVEFLNPERGVKALLALRDAVRSLGEPKLTSASFILHSSHKDAVNPVDCDRRFLVVGEITKKITPDATAQLDAMAEDTRRLIEKQRMDVIAECWEYALLNGLTEKEANARVHEKIEPYNKMLGVA